MNLEDGKGSGTLVDDRLKLNWREEELHVGKAQRHPQAGWVHGTLASLATECRVLQEGGANFEGRPLKAKQRRADV